MTLRSDLLEVMSSVKAANKESPLCVTRVGLEAFDFIQSRGQSILSTIDAFERLHRDCFQRNNKITQASAEDVEAQARELLQVELEKDGYGRRLAGDGFLPQESVFRAIAAALRTRSVGVDKDGDRYRWLKANCENVADDYGTAGQLYFGTYAAGELDIAIDTARTVSRDDGNE